MCTSEPHLQKDRSIKMEGYECFLCNRTVRHKEDPKIFGEIGTFVKDDLFNKYDINIIDKSIQGILGLLFKNKSSGFSFIVFNCYLRQISSPYGKTDTQF